MTPHSFVFLWLRGGAFETPYYVEHMVRGISDNTRRPCDFVVITDQASASETWDIAGQAVRAIPCERRFHAYQYCKLEAFRRDLDLHDRAVLSDLDNIVRRDLDPILGTYAGGFGARRNFRRNVQASRLQSSWVMFRPHAHYWLWDKACELGEAELKRRFPTGGGKGDQAFLSHYVPEADDLESLYPGAFGSYRWMEERNLNARVLFCHGRPKPHEIGWAA